MQINNGIIVLGVVVAFVATTAQAQFQKPVIGGTGQQSALAENEAVPLGGIKQPVPAKPLFDFGGIKPAPAKPDFTFDFDFGGKPAPVKPVLDLGSLTPIPMKPALGFDFSGEKPVPAKPGFGKRAPAKPKFKFKFGGNKPVKPTFDFDSFKF